MIETILSLVYLAAWALPLLGVGSVALVVSVKQREAYPRAARLAFWAGLLIVSRVLVIGPLTSLAGIFMPSPVAVAGQIFAGLAVATAFALLLWAAFPVKLEVKRLLVSLKGLRIPRWLKKDSKA